MLRFVTSLSFLYGVTVIGMLLYGIMYYRDFARSARHRKRFPFFFMIIGAACFFFLAANIYAPLKLHTFSNLDHHFIRHDGFLVHGGITMGGADTTGAGSSYNAFEFSKKDQQVTVHAAYSEDPFYIGSEGRYKLLSKTFPAAGHRLTFTFDGIPAMLEAGNDNSFVLTVKGQKTAVQKPVKKGISAWNIFKDENAFIHSDHYTNATLAAALKHLLVVRDDVNRKGGKELKFFISGRLFQYAGNVAFDQQQLKANDLVFESAIPGKSNFAWGIAFLDNNKNQFRLENGGKDSFSILYRYPVSYPMTEETDPVAGRNWSGHSINKFLLADARDVVNMPPVFREGFLFSSPGRDSAAAFEPVLLTYLQAKGNQPVQLKASWLHRPAEVTGMNNDRLLLPARAGGFHWTFSIRNTFNWTYGNYSAPWQLFLFGSLFFFFVLVLFTSIITPAGRLSWVWQLLAPVTLVLLTTRFFLYWRYKSFPPYEDMDLPSQQQLESFWNFGIIILVTLVLAILFGYKLIRYLWSAARRKTASVLKTNYSVSTGNGASAIETGSRFLSRLAVVKKAGAKTVFFLSWLLILMTGGGVAFASHFDPGICRHLAIGLTVVYFIYVFIAYRHSPLVITAGKSWWQINTSKTFDMVVSNPVKVLLSISLLATFVFTDIGFAIVFLNFLLFNEAFLCINYAIAGLSAGSRRNAILFGITGGIYLLLFIVNLLYAPFIFSAILGLPQYLYLAGYIFFALILAYHLLRILPGIAPKRKILTGAGVAVLFFGVAFFFFPKERILDKAAMTRYRIEVLTMPVDKAIESAYAEGKTWEPVIRAAQNQWFINTFIYEENNPGVQSPGFQLLPHAPQNKGAKYNAQATDLVASRFFLAEHGKWSVLLYVLLLMLPAVLLASFYKLYPDFTNRINERYPTITTGFSVLNYLLITALLVILAATGRYIFFGQDMPFGSILSKQSILFPSILIVTTILLFKNISLEYYASRKKLIPGLIVFFVMAVLLFVVKPAFNRNKEFNTGELATNMDDYIQLHLQPLMDYFDTASATRRYSIARKDRLFTDSLRKLVAYGAFSGGSSFFAKEAEIYSRLDFARHIDQNRIMYLDLYSGRPQLTFNANYFRIEPPPHLQQSWRGNVYGDSAVYNISHAVVNTGAVTYKRITSAEEMALDKGMVLLGRENGAGHRLYLFNRGNSPLYMKCDGRDKVFKPGDSMLVRNPWKVTISYDSEAEQSVLAVEPDAFMRNYYVNGSRFYVYPMANRFIWARNFAESIASEYTESDRHTDNAVVSFDFELMDSLSARIQQMMHDTAYKKGAEYGICVADGNGRLIAMSDYIKGLERPDPNDKPGFMKTLLGENGFVSQSQLRKQIGNINLLRLNPGPGSTLKPIVFSAIASQLNIDWDAFSSQGFSEPQQFFGGHKVAEYDFEINNGRIGNIVDYLKYSDNYYHSNVLLLGSYPKQNLAALLTKSFIRQNPDNGLHWPWFTYQDSYYWLDGFKNWPGYNNGEVNFGTDSSFTSIGLFTNYGIYTHTAGKSFDVFGSAYDSMLFMRSWRKSGFILPEYGLFDQQGINVNRKIPYDVFASCFRGHVKGSSQVMIPPVKMTEAFGKMVSQNRNYALTLNPYATAPEFRSFAVDNSIAYNSFLSVLKEGVFAGLKEVLKTGTAARLGSLLPVASGYYYYAKTGTTGDNEAKTKSKLMAIVISEKDIANPGFSFRNNRFYTVYFTMQNGPAKQNEEFQAQIIRFIQDSRAFKQYMQGAPKSK